MKRTLISVAMALAMLPIAAPAATVIVDFSGGYGIAPGSSSNLSGTSFSGSFSYDDGAAPTLSLGSQSVYTGAGMSPMTFTNVDGIRTLAAFTLVVQRATGIASTSFRAVGTFSNGDQLTFELVSNNGVFAAASLPTAAQFGALADVPSANSASTVPIYGVPYATTVFGGTVSMQSAASLANVSGGGVVNGNGGGIASGSGLNGGYGVVIGNGGSVIDPGNGSNTVNYGAGSSSPVIVGNSSSTDNGSTVLTSDMTRGAINNLSARNASAQATAVPEPCTWAMMVLGFGFVGGAMRARRSSMAIP